MRRAILLCVGILGLWPSNLFADSDGYFCAGRGYLAYELRVAAGPVRHELRIVRYDRVRGIEALPAVVLEDFQVHGMRCEPRTVVVVGATTGFIVDFSQPNRLPQTRRMSAGAVGVGAAQQNNLGHWAKPGVIDLEGADDDRYQLVIARASQRVPGGIEHHTVTRIVQRQTNGTSPQGGLRALLVFEGVFKETAD